MKKYDIIIKNKTSDVERAFYGSQCISFDHITISGKKDGESAFKESNNIYINNSLFELRYPCWHCSNIVIENSKMLDTCRAPFWYDFNLILDSVTSFGVKPIRECKKVTVIKSIFEGDEPFWRSRNIKIIDSTIKGFYAFFECKNVCLDNVTFAGKYSFQYIDKLIIHNSVLDTKDAFWHTKNASIYDSVINGEYLGWYSQNLTLVRCKIKGTQPLCYCKNLTLIDCSFDKDADLAFEYSEVHGNIIGSITSIKNPLSGVLSISGKYDLVVDKYDRSNGGFKII